MRLVIPDVGERWVRRGTRRDVIVGGVRRGDGDVEYAAVDYRYVAGFGGSGIWKRNVVPTQTATLEEWARLFTRKA